MHEFKNPKHIISVISNFYIMAFPRQVGRIGG